MLIKLPNAPLHLVASNDSETLPPPRTRTFVRMPPELNAQVRARAEQEGLSKMDWIFRAIRQQLAS
jgi:predicted HicB family RNase H-like nuclease